MALINLLLVGRARVDRLVDRRTGSNQFDHFASIQSKNLVRRIQFVAQSTSETRGEGIAFTNSLVCAERNGMDQQQLESERNNIISFVIMCVSLFYIHLRNLMCSISRIFAII